MEEGGSEEEEQYVRKTALSLCLKKANVPPRIPLFAALAKVTQ